MVEVIISGGDITKSEEMQIEALKEAYEGAKWCGDEENTRAIHVILRQRPICITDFVPLTSGVESIGERRDRRLSGKENAAGRKRISEANVSSVPAPNLYVWSRQKDINKADQRFYEKMTKNHLRNVTSYVTVWRLRRRLQAVGSSLESLKKDN